MKSFKRLICLILSVAMLAGLCVLSASAAGTVAYGAATVTASVLNIRSGPGTSYSIVSTVNSASTVVVQEKTTDSWYRINYNGKDGYVCTDYLKNVTTKAELSLTGKVNNSEVRYRSTASVSGSILGVIPMGTTVSVTGIDSGWYQLSYNGKTGYMRSDYITVTGAASAAAPSQNTQEESKPAEKTEAEQEGKAGTVNNNYVNFRTGPATTYSVIRMLNTGTLVTVLGESNGWAKISYNGKTGYMSSQYITLSTAETSAPSVSTPEAEQPAAPATGTTAETSAVEEMQEQGKVTGSYVNFRTGPSTNYSVIATLARGTSVEILGKATGWYKVRYNGSVGYMSSDYVSVIKAEAEKTESEKTEKSKGEEFAEYAAQFAGYRYVYGGASPSTGFDCSGLVYYVCANFGISVPHGATSQYNKCGTYVSKSDLKPGDLVFFSSNGFASITHVGIYLGSNKFIHASGSTVGVIISDLSSSYYSSVYYGAKRIV